MTTLHALQMHFLYFPHFPPTAWQSSNDFSRASLNVNCSLKALPKLTGSAPETESLHPSFLILQYLIDVIRII